jgi:flagellar biosynthetic protein FliO
MIRKFLLAIFLVLSPMTLLAVEEEPDAPLFTSPLKEYSYGHQVLNMLFALTFVVGLVIVAAWLFRKLGVGKMRFGNNANQIKIIERRPLAQKSVLYLLEVSGRRVVIADSPSGARLLLELEQEEEEKPPLAELISRRLDKEKSHESTPQK